MSPWKGLGGYLGVMDVAERTDEELYATHAAGVVRFASTLVGHADAPDVTADAFVKVTASPVWADARDPRALWMRAVVFEARTWRRANARRRAREHRAAPVSANVAGPEPEPGDPRISAALEQLPVQQRAVVVLTYWLDLAPAGAAEVLGVSQGTVRKQLARARARIREELT